MSEILHLRFSIFFSNIWILTDANVCDGISFCITQNLFFEQEWQTSSVDWKVLLPDFETLFEVLCKLQVIETHLYFIRQRVNRKEAT